MRKKKKIKVIQNPQCISTKCISEIHTFLDLLCEAKYYGKLIFYFQNGNVEYVKELSTISKTELISIIQAIKKEKTLTKNKNSMKNNSLQFVFPFHKIYTSTEKE